MVPEGQNSAASFENKFPSNFFPLIPINIEFLYIFFEFIDADLI